jgi:phosphoserine phosphatase
MNAYDFDKTIYHYDSTVRFYLWCMKRYPKIALRLGRLVCDLALYKTKRITKHVYMERFYAYLRDIPNVPAEVEKFWDANMQHMHAWYLRQHRADDDVLSASPVFLIEAALQRLGVTHIFGSPMNPATCLYEGERCRGEGKVRYFRNAFGDAEIENFYSDSHSDDPMAAIARKAWLVKGELLTDWKKK